MTSLRSLVAACASLLIISTACTCNLRRMGSSALPEVMTMNNVVMRRLGEELPEREDESQNRKGVDPHPIVLWSGDRPAAVLSYVFDTSANVALYSVDQRLVDVGGDPSVRSSHASSPFPVRVHNTGASLSIKSDNQLDSLEERFISTGDLNGDGKDELIVLRRHGAIEVYSLEKRMFEGGENGTASRFYRPRGRQRVRIGGRDTLFVVLEKKEAKGSATPSSGDPGALYRVDAQGIAKVPLHGAGWNPAGITAVGAWNRPGSATLDELIVISRQAGAGEKAFVSRHRMDGALLAPPREVYVPIDARGLLQFHFLEQSERVVLVDTNDGALYFIAPEKPANWIRHVPTSKIGPEKRAFALRAVDPKAPKVVARMAQGLFAVDEEGNSFAPGHGGAWEAMPSFGPYFTITASSPLHELVDVVPARDGSDAILIAHSRKAQINPLSHEEVLEAAQRFLPSSVFRKYVNRFTVQVGAPDQLRDGLMSIEREQTGVTEEIHTLEDWKRLLPESFNDVTRDYRMALDLHLRSELTSDYFVKCRMLELTGHRKEEYLAWLKALELAPESMFTLLQAGTARPVPPIRGAYPLETRSTVGGPAFDFRVSQDAIRIVMVLGQGTSPKEPRQAFWHLQVPWVGR